MKTKAAWSPGPGLRVLDVERLDESWLISAIADGPAICPRCSIPASVRHGCYVRHLLDLPEQGAVVRLAVEITHWQCGNRDCARRTFSALPPQIAPPHARRSSRVTELVRLLGHATGGRSAERLMSRLGMPTSDDTILRHLKRRAAGYRASTPLRIAAIDDWGWVKGRRFGTLIVDLERRRVADVLPHRSADSTASWLSKHPQIEIISRDRCGLYAQGAEKGAPQARQVADRFHLLQNLRERIEQQMSRGCVVHEAPADVGRPGTPPPGPVRSARQELAAHYQLVRQGRADVRQEMFDRVRSLRDEGHTLIAIIRETGLNWRTVGKWAQLRSLPPRKLKTAEPTSPGYWQEYLKRRWAEGCKTGRVLFEEIQALGYTGGQSSLERMLMPWRAADKNSSTSSVPESRLPPPIDPETGHVISPIIAAALCMKPRRLLTRGQAVKVQALKDASPDFVAMRKLAMRFRSLLRRGVADDLAVWIEDARRSGIFALQRFAWSLRQDLDAVCAAVTERWSNGQAEGQINKLKTLKRAMYGRAGIELLRARMLPYELPIPHTL